MIQILVNKKLTYFRRIVVHILLLTFGMSIVIPAQLVQAQTVAFLPTPGIMLNLSSAFTPAMITGMTINPENPLEFDFIIDTGDNQLQGTELSQESKKLINYFLTTLTVPEDELWVNLSPNEANRIIADDLVKTEMGRDMLAQDYLLKQLMASLMYPEEKTGREFWNRVHQKAYEKFGTTDIPTNTFNKIWIVPERAQVHVYGQNVFVVDSHLKVLLEEDYLSLKEHSAERPDDSEQWDETTKDLIRTVLIPEIEREINEGKNFANLRQIYQSMLLATWYKKNLRESLLGKIYMDQNLVKGIDLADNDIKEKIYEQYLAAFKKGVFDYIKEDLDPETQQPMPRRYFSGGLEGYDQALIAEVEPTLEFIERSTRRQHVREQVRLDLVQSDQAALAAEKALPVAYLTDQSKSQLFTDLMRAMGTYNLFGETSSRFHFVSTGFSRRAFQIPNEYPNLIFKLPRYDEQSEPPSYEEPLIMSALAERFGYEVVVIDGFELIKIEGIAPFRYYNNIVIQAYGETTTDIRHFQEVRNTTKRLGLPWGLADNPAPQGQLKNIALFKEEVDGVERKVPLITDNKEFSYPDVAMMSDTKKTSYENELGISQEDMTGAVSKFPQLADLNPSRIRTDFETELGILKKDLAQAIVKHPPLAGYDPARVREEFKKELGIEKADLAKAIIRFPPLAGLDPARVRDEFQRELGIERSALAQAILTNPQLAGYDPARVRKDFLTELGISTEKFVKALLKFPGLANYDIARVREDYKREFGITKGAFARALLKYPQLASLNAARIRKEFQDELGVGKDELALAIIQFPSIAGYSVKKNLKIKLEIIAQLNTPADAKLEDLLKIVSKNTVILQKIVAVASEMDYKIENGSNLASIYKRLNRALNSDRGQSGPVLLKANPENLQTIIEPVIREIISAWKQKPSVDEAMLNMSDFNGFDHQRMKAHFTLYANQIEMNLRRISKKIEDAPVFEGQNNTVQQIKRELYAIHPVFILSDPKSYVFVKEDNTSIEQREEWLAYNTLEDMVGPTVFQINTDLFNAEFHGMPYHAKAINAKIDELREKAAALASADQYQLVQSGERVLVTPLLTANALKPLVAAKPDEAMLTKTRPVVLTDRAILQLPTAVDTITLSNQLESIRDSLANGQLEETTRGFIYGYLLQAVEHDSPQVRQHAIEALGQLGTIKAIYAIINRENIAESYNTDPSASVRMAEYDALSKIIQPLKTPLSPLLVDDLLYFIIERPRENNPVIRQKRTNLLQQIAIAPGVSLHKKWRIINYLQGDLNPRYEPPTGRMLVTQALAQIGTNAAVEAILFRGDKTRTSRAYEPQSAIRAAQIQALHQILRRERIDSKLSTEMIAFTVEEALNHPDVDVRTSAIYLLIDLAYSGITRIGEKKYILNKLIGRFKRETDPDTIKVLVKVIPIANAYFQSSKITDQAILTSAQSDPELAERILGNVLSTLPESMLTYKIRYLKTARGVELLLNYLSQNADQDALKEELLAILSSLKQVLSQTENQTSQVKRDIALMEILVGRPTGLILEKMLHELAKPEQESFFDATLDQQHGYLSIIETIIEASTFVQTVDHAMTAASPQVRLDIAAAKLGLATDTQMFHLLMTRVPDEDILPIIVDVRRAKEDGIKGGLFNKNIFLSFEKLKTSKYPGVQKFAALLQKYPEMTSAIDRMVQHQNPQPIRGVVLPTVRRRTEQRIAEITKTLDPSDQATKELLAALRLSIASKRQIRKVLIGQIEIRQIPVFVEKILDIRENAPQAFEDFQQLKQRLEHLSALMTPTLIDRINQLINNEVSIDQLGLIEKSEFARTLRTQIAIIKAGEADAEALMTALLGEFNDAESETLADELAGLDRSAFTSIDSFKKISAKARSVIIDNERVQTKLDQLIVAYDPKPREEKPKARISIQRESTPVILQTIATVTQQQKRSIPNLTMHRFKSKTDLERLFQAEIDRFPIVGGIRQFSEFGGIMIRPKGEPKNKLSHIVFPQTALSLPMAGRSLRGHSSRTFPQVSLMADFEHSDLYAKVMADRMTEDNLMERVSLILSMDKIFFNSDIWDTISEEDKEELQKFGFGPNMSHKQWAQAINRYQQTIHPITYAQNGGFIHARELPIQINRLGAVGSIGSYHLMPEFIIAVINNNSFVFDGMDSNVKEEEIPYEIGSAHIHPKIQFEGFEAELAQRIGDHTLQMTPSPADIHVLRSSQHLYGELNLAFRKKDINMTESFLGIIGVDRKGTVIESRYLDFGDFGSDQELLKMTDLNERTLKTLKSPKPDIGLVAEHFNYIKSFTKVDFGTKTSSPHVGDNDNAMLADIEDAAIDLSAFSRRTTVLHDFAKEIRSIQSKAIIDYNRLDELNKQIDLTFKQIRRVPPAATKEFRQYLDVLVSLMMVTPVPLDFYTSATMPSVHKELSNILSRLKPESLPEAEQAIMVALSRFQSPLNSGNLENKLNNGFPVILKPFADTQELAGLQKRVNGVELNLTTLKGKTKSLVLATLGGENAVRPLSFLADLPGYTDIHTHGFSLPLEPSQADISLAEKLADLMGRSSLILAFAPTLDKIEIAEFTPQSKAWTITTEDQRFISQRLMEIGLLQAPINLHITANSRISEVEPIEESSATNVLKREDLDKLIDPPLLEAIRILYDKNILTEATSANRKDVKKGEAYIHIPYAELSDANKIIALKLGRWISDGVKAEKVFSLNIPITAETTVGELSAKAVAMAEQFKKQPLTWAITYTLDQLRTQVYHMPEMTIEEAVAEGWYYDAANEIFYLSEEHFYKVQAGRDQAMMAKTENPLTQKFSRFSDQSQFLLNKISQHGRELRALNQTSNTETAQKQLLSRIDSLLELVNSLLELPDMKNARPASPLMKNDSSEYAVFYYTVERLVQLLDSDLKGIRNQVAAATPPVKGSFGQTRERIIKFEQRIKDTIHVLRTLGRTDQLTLIKKSGKILVYTEYHRDWTTESHMKKEILHQLESIGLPSSERRHEHYGFRMLENKLERLRALNAQLQKAKPEEAPALNTQIGQVMQEIKDIIKGFSSIKQIRSSYPYATSTELVRAVVRNTIVFILDDGLTGILEAQVNLKTDRDATYLVDRLTDEVQKAKRRFLLLSEATELSFIEPDLYALPRIDIGALEEKDEAMTVQTKEKVGGIDLNPKNFDLQQSGDTIQFNLPDNSSLPAGKIEGIIPVIINITPITNFPFLLGYTTTEDGETFTRIKDHRALPMTRPEDQLSLLAK